ncbi:MAG: DUF4177 domain-containing protein [Chloroflexi bacterium]|nr:DUF4177 domain-containing protein [Chloroflexota bacterium]
MVRKWEYRIVSLTDGLVHPRVGVDTERDDLNLLGNQGWELVSVSATHSDYNGETVRAYLKRPLQE